MAPFDVLRRPVVLLNTAREIAELAQLIGRERRTGRPAVLREARSEHGTVPFGDGELVGLHAAADQRFAKAPSGVDDDFVSARDRIDREGDARRDRRHHALHEDADGAVAVRKLTGVAVGPRLSRARGAATQHDSLGQLRAFDVQLRLVGPGKRVPCAVFPDAGRPDSETRPCRQSVEPRIGRQRPDVGVDDVDRDRDAVRHGETGLLEARAVVSLAADRSQIVGSDLIQGFQVNVLRGR